MFQVTEDDLLESFKILHEQSRDLGLQVDFLATYLLEQDQYLDDTKKAFFEVLYYMSNASYEIRLFLDELAEAHEQDKFSNLYKYMIVLIYECKTTVPKLINRITKQTTSSSVNIEHITSSKKEFTKDLNAIIKFYGLGSLLEKIRNQAGAHHMSKDQSISFMLQLHAVDRAVWSKGTKFYDNPSVGVAVYTCIYLNELVGVLRDADNNGYVNELNAYIAYKQKVFDKDAKK